MLSGKEKKAYDAEKILRLGGSVSLGRNNSCIYVHMRVYMRVSICYVWCMDGCMCVVIYNYTCGCKYLCVEDVSLCLCKITLYTVLLTALAILPPTHQAPKAPKMPYKMLMGVKKSEHRKEIKERRKLMAMGEHKRKTKKKEPFDPASKV